jgi:toxin ParE1/3/4
VIIKWLEDAVYDLQALRHYIGQANVPAANSVVRKILDKVELLSGHPGIGRQGRVFNTRELVISDTPYIIPYRVKDMEVEILRVFHCAREWPEEF